MYLKLKFWNQSIAKVHLTLMIVVLLAIVSRAQYIPRIDTDYEDIRFPFELNIKQDTSSVMKWARKSLLESREAGYFFSSIDSAYISNDTFYLFYFVGKKYTIKVIQEQSVGNSLKLDPYNTAIYHDAILKYRADAAFPFAESVFDSVRIKDNEIWIYQRTINNDQITWGEFIKSDSIKINKNYLSQLLQIKPGDPYDEGKLMAINRKIKNLSFLQLISAPKVQFVGNKAQVILPLQYRKASKFDFLIGVLPGNDGTRRTWNINGELAGDFINTFGQGERFAFLLRRLSLEDQQLKVNTSLPYILGTSFGSDADFEIKRNRNLTLDVISNVGGQYLLSSNHIIKMYWSYQRSSLINLDASKILASGKLPLNLDYKLAGGGFEYYYNNLNYIFNPRSGNSIKVNTGLARRNIIKNNTIIAIKNDKLDFSTAYDSITLKNNQFSISLDLVRYQPISAWGTVRTSLSSGLKYNDDRIVENDLYRIGGNRLMRGFDELSLLTGGYIVLSTEFRLILDQNSFLSLPFIDLGLLQDQRSQLFQKNVVVAGVGMGMSFATKAGIFNISFASGNYNRRGFDFANTKLHFGYLSLF